MQLVADWLTESLQDPKLRVSFHALRPDALETSAPGNYVLLRCSLPISRWIVGLNQNGHESIEELPENSRGLLILCMKGKTVAIKGSIKTTQDEKAALHENKSGAQNFYGYEMDKDEIYFQTPS